MKRVILLYAIPLAAITGAAVILLVYNKPHPSVAGKEAKYKISASRLVEEFYMDEETAQSKYAGKILEVHGIIREVITDRDLLIVVLGDPSRMGGVSCSLQNGRVEDFTLKEGTPVTIKGVCNGMLIDVVMDNSIVIREM